MTQCERREDLCGSVTGRVAKAVKASFFFSEPEISFCCEDLVDLDLCADLILFMHCYMIMLTSLMCTIGPIWAKGLLLAQLQALFETGLCRTEALF